MFKEKNIYDKEIKIILKYVNNIIFLKLFYNIEKFSNYRIIFFLIRSLNVKNLFLKFL